MRRFARHYPRINFLIRSFVLFSAAFGGAYGFVRGSRPDVSGYDPNTFAIGASFLFALACAGLAMLSMRLRWMRKRLRKIALHNEALADRNWELKEAEERARSLFEAQGDLIVLRDGNGVVTFANDAYCALAQADRAAIVGTSHRLTVLEQGAVTVDASGTRIHDQKIASRTGPRWIAWREGLVRTDANQRAETQSVGRDVTERMDVERALGEARDHADAASRAKSRFLAMASHEIRTPLNGIIGMNGLLLETSLTPEQTTYATAVKTSAEALLSLIEELLDFSKIEAGRIDLECRPFALTALIEEITELLAPRAQARDIEIAAYVDERLPAQVMGDAARLRQVLLNLAGNAIKFTPAGGVTLLVEPGETDGEISFMVRDTGIGIAADAQARIFRDFEQADDRIARSYGGTGLGLSISERIVRRMGGHITLQSVVGQGSTFAFSVLLPEAREGDPHRPFATPDLTGKAILLVAPQCIEASLIAKRLGRWGAQTCTTSDIAVARALLPERPWHAVLIDGAFDPADVFALGEAARPHAAYRIVMVTPATRQLYQDAVTQFSGYLVKPLRSASLAARMGGPASHASPPLAAGQAAGNDRGDEPTPAPPPRGLSVLVAEDNDINALLMRALLVRLGHRVVIATDGAAALESWLAAETAGAPYDLVLMDIQMPHLDGIETTRRIRAHEAGQRARRTPILALTANALVEDRYACFEAGMDGFLVKPLDRAKLSEALAKLDGTTPHLVD
jgi:signal transduction histidine kinase/CheY-like chemotaxis protein